MENLEIIMLILFALGLALIFSALARKQAGFLKGLNPVLAGVIGVILVIPGFFYGVMPFMPEDEVVEADPIIIISDDEIKYATFQITPSLGTASTNDTSLDSGLEGFTVPYTYSNVNYSASYGRDEDEVGALVATGANFVFTVKPIAPAGATADDLATLYYEVLYPDQTIDDGAGGGPYYLFTKTGGNRQVIWTGTSGTEYVDGSVSGLITTSYTLCLNLTVAAASLGRTQNVFDNTEVQVKFSNGAGWSEIYIIEFVPTRENAY